LIFRQSIHGSEFCNKALGFFSRALLIIIFIVGSLITFLPATLIAIVVLLLTGSWLYAGIAFVVIAVLMIIFIRE